MSFLNIVEQQIQSAFIKCGLSEIDPLVRVSGRPDISDYQSNGVLAAAKTLKKNPKELAEQIKTELEKNSFFSTVSVDGPGFLNVRIADNALTENAKPVLKDEKAGFTRKTEPLKVVLDYGGPNVAKSLHIGHLRSANIGETIYRLMTFAGDTVIGENYLGDWGRPIGLMITEIKHRFPDLPYFQPNATKFPDKAPFTNTDLIEIYPLATAKAKQDEAYLEEARKNTALFQEGHTGYRALWKQFLKLSIDDMKPLFDRLNVHFDVWTGESAGYERAVAMSEKLKKEHILILDDGAYIIPLENDTGAPLPPSIFINSAGAVTYDATDIATIERRIDEYTPDAILYVIDARQALHLKQVFSAAQKIGLLNDSILHEHLAFGTINGPDNKPFKTRDGGVMPLGDFLETAVNAVYARLKSGEIGRGLAPNEQQEVAEKIGIAAVKFADLMNERIKDYIFDADKLTKTEGKTGPYILYSVVRMHSILEKLGKTTDFTDTSLQITNPTERQLLLRLYMFADAVSAAYTDRAPHILCDYAFKLMQDFNSFYHECSIKEAEITVQESRLELVRYTLKIAHILTDLLGLNVPAKM